MSEKSILKITHDYFDCPVCEFRMSNLELNTIRFDFGCPRCHAPMSMFKAVEKENNNVGND